MLSIEHPPKHAEAILTMAPYTNEITLAEIKLQVCQACKVGMAEFLSSRRSVPLVRARHIYFALARELTVRTFPQIAFHCGRRDHSTAVHGAQKVAMFPEDFEPEMTIARLEIQARQELRKVVAR
jgi:chromosomal replication initiation ATPase DnaA